MFWVMEDSSKTSIGGGQRVTLQVMRALQPNVDIRFFDSTNVMFEAVREVAPRVRFTFLRSSGRSVTSKPSFSYPFYEPILYLIQSVVNIVTLINLVRKDQPEIVYCAHKKPLLLVIVLKKIGMLHAKIIFHAHNIFPNGIIPEKIMKIIAKNCDEILCVSQRVYSQLEGKKRLVLNPISKDMVVFRRSQRISGKLRVGFVGSCLKWKGFDLFLSVADALSREDYEFKVYTRDHYPEKDHNVTYYHNLSPSEIYSEIDVLMICSRGEESFSLTALEAAFCDIPVIFPSHPAILEILSPGVSGEVYEEPSSAALIFALRKLSKRLDLYHSRTPELVNKYSWDAFVVEITKVFIP